MKHKLLTVELDGVSGIRAALKTADHIIFRRERVDDLTFAFVAPLQSKKQIQFCHVII